MTVRHMQRAFCAMTILASIMLVAACSREVPKGEYLVYVDEAGVILEGHDPVALFTEGTLILGDASQTSNYNGAIYRFASADHKQAFDAEPTRFAPQFGGHCAMSMALGKLEPADVRTWSIIDGRLVVQRNEKAKKMWAEDPPANLEKADANWPKFIADLGKKG